MFSLLGNDLDWNSEHFYLLRNGLEQNYKVLIVFLCYKIVWNVIWAFFIFRGKARESERNSERFPFRDEKDENLTERVKISVRSMFRPIIFFSEMATLDWMDNIVYLFIIYVVVCRVPGLMTRKGAEMRTTPVPGVNPRKDHFFQRLWKVLRRQSKNFKNLCVIEIPPVSFAELYVIST